LKYNTYFLILSGVPEVACKEYRHGIDLKSAYPHIYDHLPWLHASIMDNHFVLLKSCVAMQQSEDRISRINSLNRNLKRKIERLE